MKDEIRTRTRAPTRPRTRRDEEQQQTHREGLHGPDQSGLLRRILDGARSNLRESVSTSISSEKADLELGRVGVRGDRHQNLHIVGCRSVLELAFGLRVVKEKIEDEDMRFERQRMA
jgi:hypothetical protein